MPKSSVQDALPKKIKSINFTPLKPQDAWKYSVLELHERNLYDPTKPNRPPARFGVLDSRMGVADKVQKCETCGHTLDKCVGHFGVIRLALPVFHIGYFKLMITVLQNICKTCSRILLTDEAKNSFLIKIRRPLDGLKRKEVLKSLNAACKKIGICPHCSASNGTVKKVHAIRLIHEKWKKKANVSDEEALYRQSFGLAVSLEPAMKAHIQKAQEDLTPIVVQRLLERVSEEDCEVMGLDPVMGRPELFLWHAIPVPPVCIRPSVGQENSSTEDDLTVILSEIIHMNTSLLQVMNDGAKVDSLMEFWDYLSLQCAMYVTSDLPGVPNYLQATLSKIKKGICQRLKGKHGRFRGNLSGKRVDFSGRTVISPDPNLRIDEVGVPERMAMVLTYPERVTAHNIEKLREVVKRGAEQHPGAMFVQSGDGLKKFLKYGNREKVAREMKVGDIVERHLHDGDVVLFNRQPSLHKLSIMSHFVKVRPWRTLRFNECVCLPYNADFDGDEMNLHVPQTEEARAEAMELMGVKNNLVTPRNGNPQVAATQDFLTASYLLTRRDAFYDRSQFSQLCCYMFDAKKRVVLPPPAIWKPMALWTGKQVFSVLLCPNDKERYVVNFEAKCRNYEKPAERTATGQLLDPSFCAMDNWILVRNSEIMCGVVDKNIIGADNKASLFYCVLRDHGPVAAAECMNRVAKLSARFLANNGFSIGIDDVQPGEKLQTEKASTVVKGYANCDDYIHQAESNKLVVVPGLSLEETLEGKISSELSKIRDDLGNVCMKELNKYNAPLIMSLCGSKGSKLNVCQMVACVGQQIIGGKRVPNGFIDRTLPHFKRTSKAPAAKGFVKNSFYTGLSPSEFFFHAVSGREGLIDTAVKTAETGYMQRRLMKALEDLTVHYDLSVRNSTGSMVQFVYGNDGLDPAMIEGTETPADFDRIMRNSLAMQPVKGKAPLTADEVTNALNRERADVEGTVLKETSEPFYNEIEEFVKSQILQRLIGVPKADLVSGKFKNPIYESQLNNFFKTCKDKYSKARIEPGTAVGAIGAQSIGEPGTQMTLKTFHFAGLASVNITQGVPRIKEIINASKKLATPAVKAPLIASISRNEVGARMVKGRIDKTLLKDVVEYIQEVISAREVSLRIKVDVKTISDLQLEISLDSIAQSLRSAKKLKIGDSIHIEKPDFIVIAITPPKGDRVGYFQTLQNIKRGIPNIAVKGIDNVGRALLHKPDKKDPNLFELHVEGYGLLDVMGVPGVDYRRTRSNSVIETCNRLGIEAARETIIDEIDTTMRSHSITIDQRHLRLVSDLMTFKGEVLGITRFGIAKMKDSVLMLASFEKTTDHLFEAAFYGKKDEIEGVSECIIMGIPMRIGSGIMQLLNKCRSVDSVPVKRTTLFN